MKGKSNLVSKDWTPEVRERKLNNYKRPDCCSYEYIQLEDTCSKTPKNSSIWLGKI